MTDLAVVTEVSDFGNEGALDVVVEEKLREDEELTAEELIDEVDSGVHDSSSVSSNAVGDVVNLNGVEDLCGRLPRPLDERLRVQIVRILRNEDVNVPRDLENVESLLDCRPREVDFRQCETVFLLREIPHLSVGLPVMQRKTGQIIERRIEVVRHRRRYVNEHIEEAHGRQLQKSRKIFHIP